MWLANGYDIKKTPYGEGVAFHNQEGLTRSICMALTRKASLLTGAEFRYIRSAGMLLSQPALGKMMGIDGQSVARWEKTSKVPRWADKLVRLLYTAQAYKKTLIWCPSKSILPHGGGMNNRNASSNQLYTH